MVNFNVLNLNSASLEAQGRGGRTVKAEKDNNMKQQVEEEIRGPNQ